MHLASADLPPIMARACCRPMIKAMGQDSSSSMWKNGGAFFDVEMKGMRGLKSRGNQCGWEEQRRLCRVKHSASALSLTLSHSGTLNGDQNVTTISTEKSCTNPLVPPS